MRKNFNQFLIIILGISVGLIAGYFLVFGLKHSTSFAMNYIKDINDKVSWEKPNMGGPGSLQDILKEKIEYFKKYPKEIPQSKWTK